MIGRVPKISKVTYQPGDLILFSMRNSAKQFKGVVEQHVNNSIKIKTECGEVKFPTAWLKITFQV